MPENKELSDAAGIGGDMADQTADRQFPECVECQISKDYLRMKIESQEFGRACGQLRSDADESYSDAQKAAAAYESAMERLKIAELCDSTELLGCKTELAAWQKACDDHALETQLERKRHICTGVNLDMARSEAAFWKRLSLCVIGCVVVFDVFMFAVRWVY